MVRTLQEMIDSIDGGYVGFRKICFALAKKSVWRSCSICDIQPDINILRQWRNDASEHVFGVLTEKMLGADDSVKWDDAKGAASTWCYNTGWYVVANFMRSIVGDTSISDHADRGGVSVSQATDRYLADHANLCVRDTDTLAESDTRRVGMAILDTMDHAERTVLTDDANDVPCGETARKLGVSASTVSQIRNRLGLNE